MTYKKALLLIIILFSLSGSNSHAYIEKRPHYIYTFLRGLIGPKKRFAQKAYETYDRGIHEISEVLGKWYDDDDHYWKLNLTKNSYFLITRLDNNTTSKLTFFDILKSFLEQKECIVKWVERFKLHKLNPLDSQDAKNISYHKKNKLIIVNLKKALQELKDTQRDEVGCSELPLRENEINQLVFYFQAIFYTYLPNVIENSYLSERYHIEIVINNMRFNLLWLATSALAERAHSLAFYCSDHAQRSMREKKHLPKSDYFLKVEQKFLDAQTIRIKIQELEEKGIEKLRTLTKNSN